GFSLRRGCGLGIALLTPIGLVAALRRGVHPMLSLSAAFAVFYFLVAGSSPVRLARYFPPIVPLILLLVASVGVEVARPLQARGRGIATAVAVLALLAEPLRCAVGFDRVASQTDTRVLTSDWLAQRPAHTIVSIVGTGPFASSEPVLPPNVQRVAVR